MITIGIAPVSGKDLNTGKDEKYYSLLKTEIIDGKSYSIRVCYNESLSPIKAIEDVERRFAKDLSLRGVCSFIG